MNTLPNVYNSNETEMFYWSYFCILQLTKGH